MNRRGFLKMFCAVPAVIPMAAIAASSPPATTWGRRVPAILDNWSKLAPSGSFQVGGTGGIDSQMVPMLVTPGERVTIARPLMTREQLHKLLENLEYRAEFKRRFIDPVLER